MRVLFLGFGLLLPALPVRGVERPWLEPFTHFLHPELGQTERRLAEIAAELPLLPVPPGIPNPERSCFSTNPALPGSEPHWLQITLPQAAMIDTVVLIPAVITASAGVVEGFGFPRRFFIEADEGEGSPVWRLMDQTAADFPSSGFYPVLHRLSPPRRIRRVRLQATVAWEADGVSVLALSELMLLAGNRNAALHAKVEASTHHDAAREVRRKNLVDMSTPLGLPGVPDAGASLGYQSREELAPDAPKSITIEFSAPAALDEVRLIPVSREGMSSYVNYGFPQSFRLEAAMQPDFSDARSIARTGLLGPPGRNVMSFAGDGRSARYLRLNTEILWPHVRHFRFALAEIQAYSGDKNIARGAKASASDLTPEAGWSIEALTDGYAVGQRLIELPEWFRLIEKRALLLQEQTGLVRLRGVELASAEKTVLRILAALGLLVLATAAFIVLAQRRRSQREHDVMRQHFARDLHDDIGSDLGSIALMAGSARRRAGADSAVQGELAQLERTVQDTIHSLRDMVHLLKDQTVHDNLDWREMLTTLGSRLLPAHEIDLQVAKKLPATSIQHRKDIYLLCKEALHNIARHAGPCRVQISVQAAPGGLTMTITDDGTGFDSAATTAGHGLANLHARALRIHADLSVGSQPQQGTRVTLYVPC